MFDVSFLLTSAVLFPSTSGIGAEGGREMGMLTAWMESLLGSRMSTSPFMFIVQVDSLYFPELKYILIVLLIFVLFFVIAFFAL